MPRLIDADALRADYFVTSTTTNTPLYRYVSMEQIANAPTVEPASPWHRVEEPPKYTGRYVVWCGVNWYGEGMHDEFMTANYNTVSGRWSVDCDKTIRGPLIGDITYWMPAEPPKEDA